MSEATKEILLIMHRLHWAALPKVRYVPYHAVYRPLFCLQAFAISLFFLAVTPKEYDDFGSVAHER